jgi:hypothetical protein
MQPGCLNKIFDLPLDLTGGALRLKTKPEQLHASSSLALCVSIIASEMYLVNLILTTINVLNFSVVLTRLTRTHSSLASLEYVINGSTQRRLGRGSVDFSPINYDPWSLYKPSLFRTSTDFFLHATDVASRNSPGYHGWLGLPCLSSKKIRHCKPWAVVPWVCPHK